MGNENNVMAVKLINCPRCGSDKTGIIGKKSGIGVKTGACFDCKLRISSYDTRYIAWMFNRTKEEIVEHCFLELQKAPYNSYVNQHTVDIWGGPSNLKDYISVKKGWKIELTPAIVVKNGYIIDRFS